MIKISQSIFVFLFIIGSIYAFNIYSNKGANMSLMKKNSHHTHSLNLNMYEKDNNIIAEINVAGINPQDVHVEIEDGQLHIFGENRAKEEINEVNYYYKENAYGRFDRLVSLPKNIDAAGMTYEIQDGMLKIIIPKK